MTLAEAPAQAPQTLPLPLTDDELMSLLPPSVAPKAPKGRRRRTRPPVIPYERVLVIAAPRSYFALVPRDELLRTFGTEARYTPKWGAWPILAAVAAAFAAMVILLTPTLIVTLMLGYPWWTSLISVSLFGYIAGGYMLAGGFKRHIVPRQWGLQPLWCVKRVLDRWTWEPVWEDQDDGEGVAVRHLIDVRYSVVKLEQPELVPYVPRALVQEARPSGDPEDRTIQRADYFFMAIHPTDTIDWFKRVESKLGKEDAVIGAGYVVAALIAVLMFAISS